MQASGERGHSARSSKGPSEQGRGKVAERGRGASRIAGSTGRKGRRGAFGGKITREATEGDNSDAVGNGLYSGSEHFYGSKGKGKAKVDDVRDDGAAFAPSISYKPPSVLANGTIATAAITVVASDDNDEDDDKGEKDLCWICAEPVKLYSVGPCNHRTCHICALRLRALYKVRECTFCKASLDRLIFTTTLDKNFEAFTGPELPYSDVKLAISFETREALQDTLILLRYNCPDERCDAALGGWSDMKMHAKHDHHRLLCDLCISHKKIFAHEHALHTVQSLAVHMKTDHRFCEYCNTHFYSDDELFVHMRDRHEQCHICKAQGDDAAKWEYYEDYKMLEQHFKIFHYLCLQKVCLEQKFVVFSSEMDLKAHQVEMHKADLSSKELQEAMRIEANFHYEDPAGANSSSGRHGGGGRLGGRKGRNRDVEPHRPSDPQGLFSLAHCANIPGAGPANQSRRIHFGGLTTTSNETTQQQVGDAPAARAASDSGASTKERHAAFLTKVSQIMGGSDAKIQSFRSSARAFRAGEMAAKDLVDNIHSLAGDVDHSALVVHGLVDLLEDEGKKQDFLTAWNKLRVERTHFPSLVPMVGASGTTGSSDAICSVKSRSAANSDHIWANVERAATQRSGNGWGAMAGGMAWRPRMGGNASRDQGFPKLGSASNFSSAPAKRNVPGSAAYSASSRGAKTIASVAGLKTTHGSTPWSTTSSSTRVVPPSEPLAPIPCSSGSYPVSSTSKAAVGSATPPPRVTSTSAFPLLPTNANTAALAAHKRAVLSTSSSQGGSGPAAPMPAAAWASGAKVDDGMIDSSPSPHGEDLTSPPLSRGGSSRSIDVNGLSARLSEASVGSRPNGGGGGAKKSKKGVSVMSFGRVHRGN